MDLELAVVMPVYNEEACVEAVVASWRDMLSRQNIRFVLFAINDGSRDGTAERLARFADDSRIVVVNKPNTGHGPTILQGYRMAVDKAPWTFQCDSDNEMDASHFPRLWEICENYDAIFGVRHGRSQGVGRKLISAISRLTVTALFGRGVEDVNTPYRLMRSSILRRIVEQIPADTFAPNVIIAGAFARARLRIANVPVPHEGRRTGTPSIVKWKLWKSACRGFWQTLWCRPAAAPGKPIQ